jgi:hypothetical protein
MRTDKGNVSLLRETLIQIRTELGHESARAFYRFLGNRRKLDFNYAHYMKVEGGKALPSPAMVASIGSALDPKAADRLTLAYCETLFPSQRHLFKNPAPPQAPAGTKPVPSAGEGPTLIRQQYLTEAQVAALCRSSLHYSLFLALTLARGPVAPAALTTLFAAQAAECEQALHDLAAARLVRVERDEVSSIAKEMRFPKAESESMRKMYEQIDLWNFDFDRRMGFEALLQKMMIRRVSARYLGVILGHCNVLMDLVRAAEELDPSHNDDVLMLNCTLSRGKLPG